MDSITNRLTTLVADVVRPRQSAMETQAQAGQATVDRQARPEAGTVTDRPVTADDVHAAAERLKKVVQAASGRQLEFGLAKSTGSLFLEIRDRSSGEVVKQIPGEAVLELAERLDAFVGMLLDTEA